jgi:hypothetical protein
MTIQEVIDLMIDILGEEIDVTVLPAPKPSFPISSELAKDLGYKSRSIRKILRSDFEESGLGQVKAHRG